MSVRLRIYACLMGVVLLVVPVLADAQEDAITEAIHSYFDAMEAVDAGDFPEAQRILGQALRVFIRNKFDKGEFMARLSLARVYGQRGYYPPAQEQLDAAKEMAERFKDLRGQGVVLLRMGRLEMARAEFDAALALLERALKAVAPVEDRTLCARIRIELATLAMFRGEYSIAHEHIGSALDVLQTSTDRKSTARAITVLAELERRACNYVKASDLLKDAKKLADEAALPELAQEISLHAARVMIDTERFDQARRVLEEAYGYFRSKNRESRAAFARMLRGIVLHHEQAWDEAKTDLQAAVDTFERFRAKRDEACALLARARLELDTGDLRHGQRTVHAALDMFRDRTLPHGEMRALITLGAAERLHGKVGTALDRTGEALTIAGKLGNPLAQAMAQEIRGLAWQDAGAFAKAIDAFGDAAGKHGDLHRTVAQANCTMHRGVVLVRAGFVHAARQALQEAEQLAETAQRVALLPAGWLLRGRIAEASGDADAALKAYTTDTISDESAISPADRAAMLEGRARIHLLTRNLLESAELWAEAEDIYADMRSPIGELRCRAARVSIAMDREELAEAAALARKTIRFSERVSDSIVAPVHLASRADVFGNVSHDARHPYATSRLYAQSRYYGQGGYVYYSRADQGSRAAIDDPDLQMIEARRNMLQAEVALEADDPARAQREADKAIETATEHEAAADLGRMRTLLGFIHLAQGEYKLALDGFAKAQGAPVWAVEHCKALALMAENKRGEAMGVFHRAIEALIAEETRRGLRTTPARKLRRREGLYEDYIRSLLTTEESGPVPEQVERAWRTTQQLKMRRVLYDRVATGTVAFPGVPQELIDRLYALQSQAINALRRKQWPALQDRFTEEDGDPADAISRLLQKLSSDHPEYGNFLVAEPPPLTGVQGLLNDGDAYVSLLVASPQIHVFVVRQTKLRSHTVQEDLSSVERVIGAIMSHVQNPSYLRVDKSFSDVWKWLVGPFSEEVDSAGTVVFEPDGMFTRFPFEILLPGEYPDTWKEQQAAPMLMESHRVNRTTSAFRFANARRTREAPEGQSLTVFVDPSLPGRPDREAGDRAKRLVRSWRRPLSRFKASFIADSSETAAAVVAPYRDLGRVVSSSEATRDAFLRATEKPCVAVHLFCPLLLPQTPAGSVLAPCLVFSPENHAPESAFCGIAHLSRHTLPVHVLGLSWLSGGHQANERALLLTLEVLGFMGVRSVLAPLWEGNRQGEAETGAFLKDFYDGLRQGKLPLDSLRKARDKLQPTQSRKNRGNPAQYVLF